MKKGVLDQWAEKHPLAPTLVTNKDSSTRKASVHKPPSHYCVPMAHQQMFDDDDPLLERLRAFALTLPEAAEKVSHGRPAFFTTRVFAYFGGALKIGDQWVQHPQSILVKLDDDERRALLSEPRSWVPAYLGTSGWVGIDVDEDSDWDELSELVETSWMETASPQLLRKLQGNGRPGEATGSGFGKEFEHL